MPDDETATAEVRQPGGRPGLTQPGIRTEHAAVRYRSRGNEWRLVLAMRSGDA